MKIFFIYIFILYFFVILILDIISFIKEKYKQRKQYKEEQKYVKYESIRLTTYSESETNLVLEKTAKIKEKELEREKNQTNILNRFGIYYLYHLTHKDNLENILRYGLQSHNLAHQNNLINVDISNRIVNTRRKRRDPIYNRTIHDYVPLYFNPKNPMLYCKRYIQSNIIILCLYNGLIFERNTLFTDGNAASDKTIFYNSINQLDKLNWECIKAEYWKHFVEGTRIRCAEVLVYKKIDVDYIQMILCNNNYVMNFIQKMIKKFGYQHIIVKIDKSMYFDFYNKSKYVN